MSSGRQHFSASTRAAESRSGRGEPREGRARASSRGNTCSSPRTGHQDQVRTARTEALGGASTERARRQPPKAVGPPRREAEPRRSRPLPTRRLRRDPARVERRGERVPEVHHRDVASAAAANGTSSRSCSRARDASIVTARRPCSARLRQAGKCFAVAATPPRAAGERGCGAVRDPARAAATSPFRARARPGDVRDGARSTSTPAPAGPRAACERPDLGREPAPTAPLRPRRQARTRRPPGPPRPGRHRARLARRARGARHSVFRRRRPDTVTRRSRRASRRPRQAGTDASVEARHEQLPYLCRSESGSSAAWRARSRGRFSRQTR